uniref:Melanoma cell adhesion molecule b n=1 Tax=Labrus bergylta TaxID=56723 RepID=A0A3Q3G1Z5_9LABR|nr:cell surface glycoprotein MUC18 isoform X2 [Labrus bergylta]
MAVRTASFLLFGLFVTFHTWGAWADMEVNMEDRVEVYKGDTAQITCMFTSSEGIGNTIIQWFYVTETGERQKIYYQDSMSQIVDRATRFTDRISVNGTGATGEVVLTIRDVQLADGREFICLIKNLTDDSKGSTQLKVFGTPDLPTIEGVQTGISVNEVSPSKIGTCEVKNGFPRPNITWYRNNTPLQSVPDEVEIVPSVTSESSGLFSVKSELNLKVVKEDKNDEFYCEVSYFVPGGTRMTETHRINISVFYPPTAVNVWVESPKGNIKEGDSIELHCEDNGNPPSSIISIKRFEENNSDGQSLDGEVLVLNNVTRRDSGVYQCTSIDSDTFQSISGNVSVFVHFLDAAVVIPQDTIVVAMGEEFKATCNALSSLKTQAEWLKDGEVVFKGHTLTVKDATFDKAGMYECVVTVPEIEEMKTSGSIFVNVKGPPEILKPDNTEIESYDTTVDLSCMVRGFPAPKIIWSTSDGQDLEMASEMMTEDGLQSRVSIQVTSDITASCNASNDHGTDALTFNIKTPVNTTPPPVTTTTTIPTTTTTTTTTTATTTGTATATTISSATVKAETAIPPKKIRKEGSGVIIAVIIICILLLAILGSVLYFLYKKGKICGRSGKQDLTKDKSNKDNIVVEMKSDNTEEAVLLGVNGEKQSPNEQ